MHKIHWGLLWQPGMFRVQTIQRERMPSQGTVFYHWGTEAWQPGVVNLFDSTSIHGWLPIIKYWLLDWWKIIYINVLTYAYIYIYYILYYISPTIIHCWQNQVASFGRCSHSGPRRCKGWVSTGGTSQLRPQLGMSLAVESRALYAIWQQPLRGNRPVGAQSRTGAMPSTFPGL